MEDEGGGSRLGKKPSQKDGEVDYKTKAGSAWSHSFLNQKPWHPLSYPNQRRKWIAEQTHAQKERRAEEVAREYAQEQEFLRQTALINKKEKEKLEMMRAVSFMYVKPPGYNPESAKAAEISSEKKREDDEKNASQASSTHGGASSSMKAESVPSVVEKKKPKPKDVFGRALPTEEEFEVLKNAPRLDTGVAGRAKPFGVEVRNVKCLRCGNHGHQSGDRECPLKDVIMPNEENRLKRDDPLTAIMAQTDSSEPLKWELKQKPGMSPPHGGFDRDDPNQQIVAGEIFDEYGGFLGEASGMPDLLTKFTSSKTKKKSKKRRKSSPARGATGGSSSDADDDDRRRRARGHGKEYSESSPARNARKAESSSDLDDDDRRRRARGHGKKKGYSKSSPVHNARSRGSFSDADDDDRRTRASGHRKEYSEASPGCNARRRGPSSDAYGDDDRRTRARNHRKEKYSEPSPDCYARNRGSSSDTDADDGRIRARGHRKEYCESCSSENLENEHPRIRHGSHRRHHHHHHSRGSEHPEPEEVRRDKNGHHSRHHCHDKHHYTSSSRR